MVKGIGGFHLACRADDAAVVAELRRRKTRPAKPFAVMVADLAAAAQIAEIDDAAAAALSSPAAPIVLVPRRAGALADEVAPGLGDLGRDAGLLAGASPALRPARGRLRW